MILVGELRTNETMKLALQLASFGVLVLGTVHTNSAAATIDRIINAFPAEEQPQVRGLLAESLSAIIAQQLLRTRDGRGRIAAHEILLGSSALAAMIREGKTFQISNLMQAGRAAGMQTMDATLERLVQAGAVSPDDALEKALDKEAFQKTLGRLIGGSDGPPGASRRGCQCVCQWGGISSAGMGLSGLRSKRSPLGLKVCSAAGNVRAFTSPT